MLLIVHLQVNSEKHVFCNKLRTNVLAFTVLLFSYFDILAFAIFVHCVGKTNRTIVTTIGGLYAGIGDCVFRFFQIRSRAIGIFGDDIKFERSLNVELLSLGYTGEVCLTCYVKTETGIAGEVGVGARGAPFKVAGTVFAGGNLVLGIEINHFHVVGAVKGINAVGVKVEGIVDFDFNKFFTGVRSRIGSSVIFLLAGSESSTAEKDSSNQ